MGVSSSPFSQKISATAWRASGCTKMSGSSSNTAAAPASSSGGGSSSGSSGGSGGSSGGSNSNTTNDRSSTHTASKRGRNHRHQPSSSSSASASSSWTPTESFDHNLRKINRDDYLTIVAVFGSLSGLVQGFLTTLSGMMLMDEAFLADMGRYDSTFADRFIMLFFAGEIVGSMLSFPFSDTFGRKTTLIYASVVCVLAITWNCWTTSGADFLTARFFVGWTMGLLISTSPVYTSEIAMTAHRGYTIGMLALMIISGSCAAGVVYYFLRRYPIGWRVCMAMPVVALLAQVMQ